MNKIIPFAVSLIVYLTACAPAPLQIAFVPPGCTPLPPVPVCVGNSSDPKVTINMTAHTVAPPNVCAKRGTDIQFKVVFGAVPVATDTVGTLPKNLSNTWLAAKNSVVAETFTITAPTTDGKYDYSVLFADGQCRDPRISVSRD